MSETQSEIVRNLMRVIDMALNSGDCEGARFGLIVWCDCIDRPLYTGSNDADVPRVLKMFKAAGDKVLLHHDHEGCA